MARSASSQRNPNRVWTFQATCRLNTADTAHANWSGSVISSPLLYSAARDGSDTGGRPLS